MLPFAFSRHKRHCCRTNRERNFLVQLRCDQTLLHSNDALKACCDNDDHVPCPEPRGPCANYNSEESHDGGAPMNETRCSYHVGMKYYRNSLQRYRPSKKDTAEKCCAKCWNHSKCFAWTWKHKNHFCYLKNERALQGPLRLDDGSTSGARMVPEPSAPDVSCGDHRAATCAECAQGHGALRCKGECEWAHDRCIKRDCVCALVYRPVCGGDAQTYNNACSATCAGVSSVPGECGGTDIACRCTSEWQPVCAKKRTYDNICEAACDGVNPTSITPGECSDCLCSALYDPVCGADGHTYANACSANCNNVKEYVLGECPVKCICQEIYNPVCSNGTTYDNACVAKCHKVAFTKGACTHCKCGSVWDPVCGVNGETYRNACEADCLSVEYRPDTCESYALHSGAPLGLGVCTRNGLTFPDERKMMTASLPECEGHCVRNLDCTGYSVAIRSYSRMWDQCTLYLHMPVNGAQAQPRLQSTCYTLGRNCTCLSTVDPVCGEDGVTYGNPCKSRCADEWFTKGKCAIYENMICTCHAIWDPVCDSDQTTYPNECEANCANIHNVTRGACEVPEPPSPWGFYCRCMSLWQPVCGSDGETYENTCLATCAGIMSFTEGECQQARCILERRRDYLGNDLISGDSKETSWEKCSSKCGQRDDCLFWTYTEDHLNCYLKNGNSNKKNREHAISGSACGLSPAGIATKKNWAKHTYNGAAGKAWYGENARGDNNSAWAAWGGNNMSSSSDCPATDHHCDNWCRSEWETIHGQWWRRCRVTGWWEARRCDKQARVETLGPEEKLENAPDSGTHENAHGYKCLETGDPGSYAAAIFVKIISRVEGD
eukprot:GEMP01007197.1.p1 GENE.GEMP01007197.1~~GEMP01007197.1.p1  ORF type:complete len:833 (+),score=151.61 GEMP01007197.1:282-2780(+)